MLFPGGKNLHTWFWSIFAWQLGILPFSLSINLCCASSFLSASYTHDQASFFLNNCTCCVISSITSMFFIFSCNSSSSFFAGLKESSKWLTRPFASLIVFQYLLVGHPLVEEVLPCKRTVKLVVTLIQNNEIQLLCGSDKLVNYKFIVTLNLSFPFPECRNSLLLSWPMIVHGFSTSIYIAESQDRSTTWK